MKRPWMVGSGSGREAFWGEIEAGTVTCAVIG